MKDELQNRLVEILDKMVEGVETGADFLQGELPSYLKEVLLWYGVYNFILFLFSITLLGVSCKLIPYLFKKIEDLDDFDDSKFLGQLALTIYTIISIIVVLININLVWLQIWIAPKVWLVEYIGKLVS